MYLEFDTFTVATAPCEQYFKPFFGVIQNDQIVLELNCQIVSCSRLSVRCTSLNVSLCRKYSAVWSKTAKVKGCAHELLDDFAESLQKLQLSIA